MEKRDELFSDFGGQEMDTSAYHVSEVEKIEYDRDDTDLNMGVVSTKQRHFFSQERFTILKRLQRKKRKPWLSAGKTSENSLQQLSTPESQWYSQVAEKTFFWNQKRKYSGLQIQFLDRWILLDIMLEVIS